MGLHNEFVEFDQLTSDPTTPPDGCTWYRSDLAKIRSQLGGSAESLATLDDVAASFEFHIQIPNSADWAVNALAPLVTDSNNAALQCWRFDDTLEEGLGFVGIIPVGVTTMKLKLRSRAETAPAGTRTVGVKIYNRGIPDNVAIDSWSTGDVLTDIDIPTNELWQYDDLIITLATLGATAGEMTQFELTRINPTAGTELVGDWDILFPFGVRFS